MLNAVLAGLISGLVSPLVLQWLQHKFLWQRQKKLETKYGIFSDAVRTLSLLAVDAADAELQSSRKTHLGIGRQVELRTETVELLQKTSSMVDAFFTEKAASAFRTATSCNLKWENLPHLEFQEKSVRAIILLSIDLGILP